MKSLSTLSRCTILSTKSAVASPKILASMESLFKMAIRHSSQSRPSHASWTLGDKPIADQLSGTAKSMQNVDG